MTTLLLHRSDVARNMGALMLLSEMREAFLTAARHASPEPPLLPSPLPPQRLTRVSAPGTLWGLPAYGVRVQGERADASGLTDTVHLHALDTGALLAVMDAGHLTAMRAGVVGALAADVLARPDAARVALVGMGVPASMHLKSLRLVRSLQHVRVYDNDLARVVEFSSRLYQELNLPVRPAESVEEAVEDADVVLCMRPAGEPWLFPGMVRAGTHVTAQSEDSPEPAALSAGLVRQSTLLGDAELGEVLAGTRAGRTDSTQVTLFAARGLPFQDLVVAWHVYQGALLDESVRRVEFGA